MAGTWSSFTDRLIRSAQLESSLYEEVEADTTATPQAALVVVLGAIAAAIGTGLRLGLVPLIFLVLVALSSWSFYAWLAYFFGGTLLKGPNTRTNWGEIARTLGFATSPRLLLLLGLIPGVGVVIALIVPFWIIGTTVVGLRAALDCGTGRALAVAVIASLSQSVLTVVLLNLQASGA